MRRLTALGVFALALTLLAPAAALADAGSDAAFVSRTNAARSSAGLRPYAVAADLTALARRQAARMAAAGALAHNPALASQVCCWTDLGENVGRGTSVDQVQSAFLASPEHRANILSARYTQIGVGTARGGDGRLYVDEVFRRPTGSVVAAPAPPPPATTPVRTSRNATRAPYSLPSSPHALLMRRVRAVWHAKVYRHYERFDPLRRSLDYYAVMTQLTRVSR